MRSGQPRIVPSPGRRRELRPGGLARGPTGVGPDRCCELRQRPQIRWRWRREACSSPKKLPKRLLAETAPGLDNLEALPFEAGYPEVPGLYSRYHTQTRRSVCVFDAPEGPPRRISPTATCLTPLSRSGCSSRHSPEPKPGRRSLERVHRSSEEGRVQPLLPKRQARRGRVARERARCVRPEPDEQVAVARASGPAEGSSANRASR